MDKIIEIDINDKNDLIEKYNKKAVSNDLIEYIIKQAMLNNKGKVKIVINKNCYIEQNCSTLIKEGLKDAYNGSLRVRNITNAKQVGLLILGILLLSLSSLISDETIWKEVLLISGWVPIWEVIELELFPDAEGRVKRKIIRNLLNCEIVENNIIEEIIM